MLSKPLIMPAAVDTVDEIVMPVNLTPITAAQDLLKEARRPVIVTGLGLEPERPYVALRQLAEALGAPVIDTPKSKGALPADHPLAVGTIGLTFHDAAYQLLDEADCIVAVGFDVVELVRPWEYTAPLIWIAPWPNAEPTLPTACEFVGPMTPVLEALAQGNFERNRNWGQTRVTSHRHTLADKPLPQSEAGMLSPQEVLSSLRDVMPPETLVTTDVGSHKIFTALNWRAFAPNRYMVSNGLSCMGYGLPAAIAAARVLSEPVVCITGDGGLAMNMGELGLLMEHPLPVIVVLMNDSALDLIRYGQQRDQLPVFGTEFQNPDYEAVLRGYRLHYCRVTDTAGCAEALRIALDDHRPWFIDAIIDPAGYRG
jgi:acetolactate synthase-1/2/3 large subunit